jgi:RecB family exonuclease
MKLIRRSEVVEFLRCRKAWDYNWNQQIEPARPDGKLFFGNLFHKFIEVYYNNIPDPRCQQLAKDAMANLFNKTDTSRMEQTELDELWELAGKVTSNYCDQWWHIDKTWNVIATELKFAIPLDGDLYYTGTIDLIFKDQDGKLFFIDHKTASSIERYQSKVELDTQISCYWWALQQLARGNGFVQIDKEWTWIMDEFARPVYEHISDPAGFVYNIILKDYPTPPEPLKKGGLSKAKNQKTTYAVYMKALEEMGLEVLSYNNNDLRIPEEYDEILAHLSAQETEHGNRFFRRIPVTRSEYQVQVAMNELLATTLDIEAAKENQTSL